MIRRVDRHEIRAGMYIHGFGGSWFRHPFWHSKFLLASPEDVAKVRNSGVPYVLIDDELGDGPEESHPESRSVQRTEPQRAAPPARARPAAEPRIEDVRRADERKQAQELVRRSMKAVRGIFDDARLGRAVRIGAVSRIVDDVQDSIARSPHALLSVIRLKSRDEYTYAHSVAVCTLMVNAARHIGLDDATVRDFGLAGLLHDIGKMGVPEDVLNKPGRLTDEEFALMKGHPDHGYMLLRDLPGMREVALDVCRHHHEKMDGTGYPFGMGGEAISIAARLGAICDVYDALTSDRAYKDAWTPAQAVAAMWSWEGHFDPGLFFSFMQSIGVFPAGILVQLRSNRLGIVLDTGKRTSRPRVCAFYATRERRILEPEIVVIKDSLAADQIIAPERPERWGFADWDGMMSYLLQGKMPPIAA
ncbi:MAG TPA: HD-GYP domain-containing protein [Sphingobium sp.]|uniref:HD-GYP domain-containing protein n=1 Tax=Sphingobium sp. TaxID=1912891 RepID=UPI002ED543F6